MPVAMKQARAAVRGFFMGRNPYSTLFWAGQRRGPLLITGSQAGGPFGARSFSKDLQPDAFDGRIAQLVEQLTLNQRVLGSSPSAPTIESSENKQ